MTRSAFCDVSSLSTLSSLYAISITASGCFVVAIRTQISLPRPCICLIFNCHLYVIPLFILIKLLFYVKRYNEISIPSATEIPSLCVARYFTSFGPSLKRGSEFIFRFRRKRSKYTPKPHCVPVCHILCHFLTTIASLHQICHGPGLEFAKLAVSIGIGDFANVGDVISGIKAGFSPSERVFGRVNYAFPPKRIFNTSSEKSPALKIDFLDFWAVFVKFRKVSHLRSHNGYHSQSLYKSENFTGRSERLQYLLLAIGEVRPIRRCPIFILFNYRGQRKAMTCVWALCSSAVTRARQFPFEVVKSFESNVVFETVKSFGFNAAFPSVAAPFMAFKGFGIRDQRKAMTCIWAFCPSAVYHARHSPFEVVKSFELRIVFEPVMGFEYKAAYPSNPLPSMPYKGLRKAVTCDLVLCRFAVTTTRLFGFEVLRTFESVAYLPPATFLPDNVNTKPDYVNFTDCLPSPRSSDKKLSLASRRTRRQKRQHHHVQVDTPVGRVVDTVLCEKRPQSTFASPLRIDMTESLPPVVNLVHRLRQIVERLREVRQKRCLSVCLAVVFNLPSVNASKSGRQLTASWRLHSAVVDHVLAAELNADQSSTSQTVASQSFDNG